MNRRRERFIDGYDLHRILEEADFRNGAKAIGYYVNLPPISKANFISEEKAIAILRDLVDEELIFLRLLARLKVWTLEEIVEDVLQIKSFR